MAQEPYKHHNFTRNVYRSTKHNIIELDRSRFNSTPVISHDDPELRKRVIRKQVKPFNANANLSLASNNDFVEFNKVNPANHRKVIDFQTAIISEPEKWNFIQTMMELCERLSAHFDTPIYDVNEAALYALFQHYDWTCPVTGKVHSYRYSLTIEFLKPVWCGGKIKLSNMRPIYTGWLPGEYRWAGHKTLSEMAAA